MSKRNTADQPSRGLLLTFGALAVLAMLSFILSMILLPLGMHRAGITLLVSADALMLAVTIYVFVDRRALRG